MHNALRSAAPRSQTDADLFCSCLQPRRQTAPFQLFSALKYSTLQYLNQHPQPYPLILHQLSQLPIMTRSAHELPQPMLLSQSQLSRHRLQRISLPTCPLATMSISPVTPPLREHLRVDMVRTSMLGPRYTVFHLCDSIVNGCC